MYLEYLDTDKMSSKTYLKYLEAYKMRGKVKEALMNTFNEP